MINRIINKLNELRDIKYRDFSSSLNPTALPMIGVRIPELRKIAKDIVNENPKYFLDNNPMSCFELVSLHAMVIGYMKEDIDIVLKYLETFIPMINDWSVNAVSSTFISFAIVYGIAGVALIVSYGILSILFDKKK